MSTSVTCFPYAVVILLSTWIKPFKKIAFLYLQHGCYAIYVNAGKPYFVINIFVPHKITCTINGISAPLTSLQTRPCHISVNTTISNLTAKYTVCSIRITTGSSQQNCPWRDAQRHTGNSFNKNEQIISFREAFS